ncbi:MAG TPA: hypothetical protein VFV05_02730 [Methylomirabilota bacterium]|nr:hypothetical protein [Methylomirabilota bacterium]
MVAGCVTLERPPSPPTGSMWAFFTDTDVVLGPRALVYTSSLVACETERRRRVENSPCVQVVVGPGTDYYALGLPSEFHVSLPDGAIGAIEYDRCGMLQATFIRAYRVVGRCQPIGVKRAP